MKIGVDISQIVYGTGVSRYYKELIKHLLKIDSKNEYVLFSSSLRQNNEIEIFKNELSGFNNVSFKQFRIPPIVLEIVWNRLKIFPIESFVGDIDIFHTSDWLEPPTKRAKKVTTIHDMIVYLFPASLPKRIVTNQKRKLKIVKKESKRIIADSQTTKQDINKFLDYPLDQIQVIPLAVDNGFIPQLDEKINEVLLKFKIKKPFVLSVGTQDPRKNITLLIDAFEDLIRDFPNLSLVLTGKKGWGPQITEVTNLVQTGYVTEEELKALYSASHAFVYPSLYEGFGLPILEAMACGTPVVTSNNSSMQEIAKDAAVLIDPRNKHQLDKALRFILNLDKDNYQKMVSVGIDRARSYSWTKTAKSTLEVYRSLEGK